MAPLPIIVLAFANEHEGRRYLRDLPAELRGLQETLREAEGHGLCRVELLPNATLDQLFAVFARHRNEVALLHYAGHADSGRLLLEASAAGGAAAHAAGLATFLGQCGGLQLVFLNGCSTRAQVGRLLEAGVAAVIATARAIDDGMARTFAVAFYTELASGAPLRVAYEAARGRVLAAWGDSPPAYYQNRELGDIATGFVGSDPSDDQGFPWEFRSGTELVERWSLPDAAGNPEFGLPRLPERDLPESPFRHLNRFTAEHAEVFFGRGHAIRELHELVNDPGGPPILLFYGASGVGKSSLLDAGLVPRLESGGTVVRYCRREQQKGLSVSLLEVLPGECASTPVGDRWRAEEAQLGKPLVIVLDQVEEVFTRPDPAQPQELDRLVSVLTAALGSRDTRPRGKLLLGFRKEWLAELDRRFAEAKLPRTRVFLEPLDRRGIIEAVRGAARPGRLERHYRLVIEVGLPEIIADDLLADAGSAVAPTLQVLLTKMWDRARQLNPALPRFDRSLYTLLKGEGYLLKDVLDEGLNTVGRWNSEVEVSGLALDLLSYHTTDLGTAAQHTRAELSAQYAHQVDALEGLLIRCKDSYLLIKGEPGPDGATPSTRLAHDLLAPLVQQRFRLSIKPGQRARRLLENRAPEWKDRDTGSALDSADLATVEAGAQGMRVRTTDEMRLVEASRVAEQQRTAEAAARRLQLEVAEERRRQSHRLYRRATYTLLGISGLVLVLTIVAWFGWREAGWQRDFARAETETAEQRLRIANGQRLGVLSKQAFPGEPQQCVLLAVEAIRATRDSEEPAVPAAVQALEDALSSIGGRPLAARDNSITAMAFAPDGRLVTGGDDGMVRVWDLKADSTPTFVLRAHEKPVTQIAFASGGRMVTASDDQTVRVWNLENPTGRPIVLVGLTNGIRTLAVTRNGRWVTASDDGETRVWDVNHPGARAIVLKRSGPLVALASDDRLITADTDHAARVWNLNSPGSPALILRGHKESIEALALSSDGRLVTASLDGDARVWDLANAKSRELVVERTGSLMAFAPDGRLVITGSDPMARVLDIKNPSVRTLVVRGHEATIDAVAFTPDGRLVTGSSDKTARLWDLERSADRPLVMHGKFNLRTDQMLWEPEQRAVLRGHEQGITQMTFAPDGRLVTLSDDKTARVWDLRKPTAQPVILQAGLGYFGSMILAPDGRLVTAGDDGLARIWDIDSPMSSPLVLRGHQGAVAALAASPGGRLVTGGLDGTARVWLMKSLASPPIVLRAHDEFINVMDFTPDGRLATASIDGSVRVWNLDEPDTMPRVFRAHPNALQVMAISPDGKLIVVGVPDDSVWVYDLKEDGKPFSVLRGHDGRIGVLALSPGGQLVTGGDDGSARVWDLKDSSGSSLVLRGAGGKVKRLAFSPGGRLVTGCEDGAAQVWDVQNPSVEPVTLRGPNDSIESLVFASDGRLVIGYWDGTIRVWDLSKPFAEPLLLRGHENAIKTLLFARDGRLISGSRDGTARVWEIDVDKLVKMAGEVASRNLTAAEWQQFFGERRYRRTFPDLPDGVGVTESDRARGKARAATASRP